jgi:ribonuclease T2
VIDFFETVISFFLRLTTWDWLSDKKIVPSNSTSYTLSDIQDALKDGFGHVPYVGCSGPRYNTTEAGKGSDDNGFIQLSEAWYYFHVYGRPQRDRAKHLDATVAGPVISNCAKAHGAIWYYERAKGSEA